MTDRRLRPATWLAALALATATLAAHGAELAVGPGQAFGRIEQALAQAQPGDVVLVHPLPENAPYEREALRVTVPRLTIRAAAPDGRRVPIDGRGYDYSGRGSVPRAIVQFNRGADGCVLEGFELHGAHNASHNGAGVRINQANDVTVRGCDIHNNDMGVMSNGDGTPATASGQLIERCLIRSNGDTSHPGYNHNLYLGGTSVTLLACEVHSSLTGHNVKSRAHRTAVIACYVHDSANREFDLVDARGDTTAPGSDAVLAGNIIVKAPQCRGNRAVIHFGQDGGHDHTGTLYLVHNTIVTPYISPVVTLSAPGARAALYNNIVWNGGAEQHGQVLVDARGSSAGERGVEGGGNWVSGTFGRTPLALGAGGRHDASLRGRGEGRLPAGRGGRGSCRPGRGATRGGRPGGGCSADGGTGHPLPRGSARWRARPIRGLTSTRLRPRRVDPTPAAC